MATSATFHAGVRTPELLIFDDDRDVVDAPVTMCVFTPGRSLGEHGWAESDLPLLRASRVVELRLDLARMNAPTVRRTLVHLRAEAGATLLTLDVLLDGRVRLHSLHGRLCLCAETTEDLLSEAAASDLDPELYAALLWELDLLALRGDGGWSPG